jgi:hypothetical protein
VVRRAADSDAHAVARLLKQLGSAASSDEVRARLGSLTSRQWTTWWTNATLDVPGGRVHDLPAGLLAPVAGQ